MNEKAETYCLAAYGLARGLFNVYIRPIPNDMLTWAAGRLIDFEMPDQDTIDELIREQSQL